MAGHDTTIGVIYVLHGGMDKLTPRFMWDAGIHMFSYDRNHPVYNMVIWNRDAWPMVLQTEFAVKFIRKYEFEYERIGGVDPFHRISDMQLAAMKDTLDQNTMGVRFEVDYACWMASDRPEHYPYPRFLYNGPEEAGDTCRYCGEDEPDGPWPGCDPERFNVDGPAERLLKKGASRIIMVDMAVGGPRFYKSFDVVQMTRRAVKDWSRKHDVAVPLVWVNDYSGFMERCYPEKPAGWTPMLGDPEEPQCMLLSGSPNPVAADPELALLHVEGIEAAMSTAVSDAATGIVLFNHGMFMAERRFFDPKIDDTTLLNKNIKNMLLKRHPGMDPDSIVGAYGGVKELNPENNLVERTRSMRGEDIAHAYLLGTDDDLPGEEWGYRYWDALAYLKNRGVRHIVIGFPQVITDSVLTLVELYNQVGKEIGTKTWLKHAEGDFDRYPEIGHPFAEHWGNWVDTACKDDPEKQCCLTMGGCGDGGPYPPQRQTPLDEKRDDMDPSLAFDLSEFGHLGYDPEKGRPDPGQPVQDQYTGTWDVYVPPNSDVRLSSLLAKHVLHAALHPMVYITNGNCASTAPGENVTWKAFVSGGSPQYSVAWYIRRQEDTEWTRAGEDSTTWQWSPGAGDSGIYDICCRVTDAEKLTGDVMWKGFLVE